MSGKGTYIAQDCHVVNILPAVDINAGVNSDVFSMKNFAHATIIITLGVTGAACTVTVEACDDFVPSNVSAIPFAVYKEETAAGDTLGAKVAAGVGGFASSTNNGIFYVIEVDASELPAGYPNLRVVFSNPGAATFAAALAILSGAREAGDQNATAIA